MFKKFSLTVFLALLGLTLLPACVSLPDQAQLVRKDDQVQQSPDCSTPVSAQSATAVPLEDGFSLVSWNIHKGSETGWLSDLQDIAHDADLLLLQEAYLGPDMQQLLDGWSPHWVMSRAFSFQGVHAGVLTAARFSDAAACSALINEPLFRIPKALLINYYPIAGQAQPMLVANIHGVNFTMGTQQLAQQLDFIAKAVAEHKGPVIMAGDFNTWSQARMRLLRAMAVNVGLQAVDFDAQQQSKHLGKPVDHIYYRGLKLVDSQVLAMHTSDHRPLKAQFELE